MKIKRLLACVLTLLMVPSIAMTAAYATSDADATTSGTSVSETVKKQKETQPPINFKNVGMEKYINHLESMCNTGTLGVEYSKKKTTFKLWSPLAQSVKVCIYTTGTDNESGAQMISKTSMKLDKSNGTWSLTLNGDYKNKYYTYLVTVDDVTNEVVDPYAKAVGANGDRGMIVNLNSTDPKNWDKDSFERVDDASKAVIWEINIRDFSASESSGVSEENRGKFLAFTEDGTTVDSVEGSLSTCIDYLKDLGVNYVQINPFYDFASIDETDTQTAQYNWGYDPKNYNVPEGSYSSDPYNGTVRIKECKQMIQALHSAGIGVIMDVVYNHTYASNSSWFNCIVPYYYYRVDENGVWSNGSGCGNDTASERTMYREFMKNSVVYWAQEYHIDGFRFDLMGLHDVDTMNYIRESLDELKDGEKIIMYGEAWNLSTNTSPDVKLATQDNLSLLSERIGAFNDTTRDGLKGDVFNSKDTGFIQSGSSATKVKQGISGMSSTSAWGTNPSQCINYASCHDNLSLYDKLVASVYPLDEDYRKRREDLVSMNKLSAAVILTSQGVPFMMAGEEFARSKDGDENSYKSPVEVNQINWNDLNKYADLNDYYKGLIDIRNTVDILTDPNQQLSDPIEYIDGLDDGVIAYSIKGYGNTKAFAAVFNGSDNKTTVNLPDDLCKVWIRLADENTAGIKKIEEISDYKVTLEPHSCAILVNKSSFNAYENIDKTCSVIVKYYDTETQSVVYEQLIKGKSGDNYSFDHPAPLLYQYDIISSSVNNQGVFDSLTKEITIKCKQYTGDYSSVTIHYVNEFDEDIANSIVLNNRVGQKYTTPQLLGIYGYRIDLERLPTNGAGTFTKEPIVVTYRYNSIEVSSEEEAIDPERLDSEAVCIANVIYMSDNGVILDTKSYAGDKGTEVSVEYLEFEGYMYVDDTAQGAVFDSIETNIIVNYEKEQSTVNVAVIITIITVLLLLAIIIILLIKKNRNKDDYLYSDNIDIVEDLYIE